MALESLGIGGVLKFNETQAVEAIKRAGQSLGGLAQAAARAAGTVQGKLQAMIEKAKAAGKNFRKLGQGFGQMGQGAGVLARAGVVAGAGFAVAGRSAVMFEQQMANVRAVTGATPAEFAALAAEAKRMGAATSFSAVQAAEGLENLGRAGFSTQESIAALEPVLRAAEADGMDLATAADIVANTLRGMGLAATEAGSAADILAATSANSNTNIVSLGEGMKFVAPVARQMGVNLKETSFALGVLANAGLKGTLGGTALKNMLLKLSKPNSKVAQQFNQMGIKVQDAHGNMLPLAKVSLNLAKGLPKLGGNMKQAAFLAEAFGLRGIGAAQNLAKGLAEMQKSGKGGVNAVQRLKDAIENSEGAAKRMSETKLDTMLGQFKLLMSAAEGLAIELFEPFKGTFKGLITTAQTGLQQVVQFLQFLQNPTQEGADQISKFGLTVRAVAVGIRGAMTAVVSAVDWLRAKFKALAEGAASFLGPDRIAMLTKFGILLSGAAAAAAPLLLGIAAIASVVSTGLVPMLVGLKTIVVALAGLISGPLVAAVGAVVLAFALFKNENETVLEAGMRLWTMLSTAVMDFWNGTISPLIDGIMQGLTPAFEPLYEAWTSILNAIRFNFGETLGFASSEGSKTATDWIEIGRTIGAVLGGVATAVAQVFSFAMTFSALLVNGIKTAGTAIKDFLISPIDTVLAGLRKMAAAFLRGLKVMGKDVSPELERLAQIVDPEKPKLKVQAVGKPPPSQVALIKQAENQARMAAPATQKVSMPAPPTPKIENKIRLNVAGREVAFAVAENQKEIHERAGFRSTAWQRRQIAEQGMIATGR